MRCRCRGLWSLAPTAVAERLGLPRHEAAGVILLKAGAAGL